jgi:hypothetical protein
VNFSIIHPYSQSPVVTFIYTASTVEAVAPVDDDDVRVRPVYLGDRRTFHPVQPSNPAVKKCPRWDRN